MNILFICNKSPYPPKEGGPIAMNAIIEGMMRAGHRVKILAINTNKYAVDINQLPENYRQETAFETVYIDLSIKPLDAFLNLFTKKSYHVQRFITKAFREKIISILSKEKFDIIQLETLYIAPYIDVLKKYSDAPLVLRAHNIEHLIWQRIWHNCKNPLKKFYLGHLYRTLKRFELNAIKGFDGIVAITSHDADFFRKQQTKAKIIDIPFGIRPEKYTPNSENIEFPSLFHLGSMNWMPNLEGIEWFLNHVWPEIHRKQPELKFYLAGREMPEWLFKIKTPGIVVLGEVDDASLFMNSKAVMIVPLFSGSGIRIKIIEGMAMAKTIISTSIGAEGINCSNEENIYIANNKDEFIQAIDKSLESETKCRDIGNNARKLIEEEHNQAKLSQGLTNFYKNLLDIKSHKQS